MSPFLCPCFVSVVFGFLQRVLIKWVSGLQFFQCKLLLLHRSPVDRVVRCRERGEEKGEAFQDPIIRSQPFVNLCLWVVSFTNVSQLPSPCPTSGDIRGLEGARFGYLPSGQLSFSKNPKQTLVKISFPWGQSLLRRTGSSGHFSEWLLSFVSLQKQEGFFSGLYRT